MKKTNVKYKTMSDSELESVSGGIFSGNLFNICKYLKSQSVCESYFNPETKPHACEWNVKGKVCSNKK